MSTKLNIHRLPMAAAGLGFLTLLARIALSLLGEDEKGLLIPGHPLAIGVWGLTAAAAILVLLSVWNLKGSRKYSDNFHPSTAAAIGAFALAGGIAVTVLLNWNTYGRLDLIRNLCGAAAIPALIFAGLYRWQGKRPFFPLHALVCLYLTLYAVSHYQLWSSRPQIHHWFFTMAGSLLLTLFAYYQAAFDASMAKRRLQLATGLLAGFFCIAATANAEDVALYLGGALWALTNLCSLTPVRRRRKNPLTDNTGEDCHESA